MPQQRVFQAGWEVDPESFTASAQNNMVNVGPSDGARTRVGKKSFATGTDRHSYDVIGAEIVQKKCCFRSRYFNFAA